jgi:hypothetical protein
MEPKVGLADIHAPLVVTVMIPALTFDVTFIVCDAGVGPPSWKTNESDDGEH